jgi:hypothetical protein
MDSNSSFFIAVSRQRIPRHQNVYSSQMLLDGKHKPLEIKIKKSLLANCLSPDTLYPLNIFSGIKEKE